MWSPTSRASTRPTTLATYDEETYRRIFDINVLGVLNVIAAARPRLRRGASVVNFASVDAFTVSRGQLLYGASKAAVVMLTKALALELAPDGIRVNGIAPGWVATPGNAATGRMEAAAASIPLGRVATPEEIAAWVWLVSQPEYGAFLDGETIVLSGADVMPSCHWPSQANTAATTRANTSMPSHQGRSMTSRSVGGNGSAVIDLPCRARRRPRRAGTP